MRHREMGRNKGEQPSQVHIEFWWWWPPLSISCVRAGSDLSNKLIRKSLGICYVYSYETSCTFKLKVIVKFNMLRLVLCAGVTWSECSCSSVFVCSFTFIVQFHQHHRAALSLLQCDCECVLLGCVYVYTWFMLQASNGFGIEVHGKKSKRWAVVPSPSTKYRSIGQ